MLAQFRQTAPLIGRTLLGMLLFVWLSIAIAPCVMANDFLPFQTAAGASDSAALHAKMENCAYCPAEHSALNSVQDTMIICQNAHNTVSDSMTFVSDSVDVASFVLFEIPTSPPITQLMASRISLNSQRFSATNTLPPLVLTGILRI